MTLRLVLLDLQRLAYISPTKGLGKAPKSGDLKVLCFEYGESFTSRQNLSPYPFALINSCASLNEEANESVQGAVQSKVDAQSRKERRNRNSVFAEILQGEQHGSAAELLTCSGVRVTGMDVVCIGNV